MGRLLLSLVCRPQKEVVAGLRLTNFIKCENHIIANSYFGAGFEGSKAF